MPRTAKSNSKQGRSSKFLYGAIIGAVIGTLAVTVTPAIAINILVGLAIVAGYLFFISAKRRSNPQWSQRAASPAPVLGALVIGVMSVAGVQYLGLSLAWNPEGVIKKSVQNVTQGGQLQDADSNTAAVEVKPGDIIKYSITVSNIAGNASNHDNDMAYTKMTDTLPAGVELVSNPSKRTITEDIGTILPGQSVTKTYELKVTSTTNGAYIKNEACFTADSVVHDKPQNGCNPAIIKVKVPPTPPTPTPPTPTPPTPTPPTPTPPTPTPPTPTPPTPTPPTPTPPTPTPPTPTTPTPPTPPPTTPAATEKLPNVGAGSIAVIVLFTAIIGYIFSAVYGYVNSNKSIKFK